MKKLCILLLLITKLGMANAISDDKTIVVSSLPDNPLINWAKKYIHQAYTNIGFKVVFKQFPPLRGLSEANAGHVDALLVRADLIEHYIPNFVRVPVVIGEGQLVLYCNISVLCDHQALEQKQNLIGVVAGTGSSADYMQDKTARTYEVTYDTQISKMLELSRLDYILSINIKGYGNYSSIDQNQYQQVVLSNFQAFHYISQDKVAILPLLTQSLIDAKAQADLEFTALGHQ